MKTQFNACQTIALHVPELAIPIEHYLRQPQRLVRAITDSKRIEQLSASCFRLKMRPLQFMMFSAQPVVDLEVWTDADGILHIQSIATEIRGVESISLMFGLNLTGYLYTHRSYHGTQVKGKADLTVQLKLPPSLWLTPRSIVEKAGNALLKTILQTIKQRLEQQLLMDYQNWASTKPALVNSTSAMPLESLAS
jgi:hypothetical protein